MWWDTVPAVLIVNHWPTIFSQIQSFSCLHCESFQLFSSSLGLVSPQFSNPKPFGSPVAQYLKVKNLYIKWQLHISYLYTNDRQCLQVYCSSTLSKWAITVKLITFKKKKLNPPQSNMNIKHCQQYTNGGKNLQDPKVDRMRSCYTLRDIQSQISTHWIRGNCLTSQKNLKK